MGPITISIKTDRKKIPVRNMALTNKQFLKDKTATGKLARRAFKQQEYNMKVKHRKEKDQCNT